MRAFIGIKIPEEIRKEYSKLCRPLRDTGILSFVRPEKMHITIAFFKDLKTEDFKKVAEIIQNLNIEMFPVNCSNLGLFKRKGVPSTVYVNIQSEELTYIAKEIHEKLKNANIEFDDKQFVPHITLARVKELDSEADFMKKYNGMRKNVKESEFFTDYIHVYSSDLITYKKVESIKLEETIDEFLLDTMDLTEEDIKEINK